MADDAKQAWNDVAERFSSWGRHVADRYKEMGSVAGETAQESQRKLEEAAREVSEQLSRAFTALGETLRDERAKTELKDAVRAFGDAMALTVTETGAAIRRHVGSGGPEGGASDTAA
jgi:DNA-binding ferritin-like protein